MTYKRLKMKNDRETTVEPSSSASNLVVEQPTYTSTDLYINHTPVPQRKMVVTKSPSPKQGSSSSQADPLMRCFVQGQQVSKIEKTHNFFMAENLLSTPPMKKLKVSEEFGVRVNLSPEINDSKKNQEKYVEKFSERLAFRVQRPLGESLNTLSQNFLLTNNSPKYYRYESPSK